MIMKNNSIVTLVYSSLPLIEKKKEEAWRVRVRVRVRVLWSFSLAYW
jgi:hypothetical protein